ncbi:hypothetical protein EXS45_01315 [Candidatus Nomurabacteria bacterium]|nr:hypothetical protein [Candidatus Nomurabacteria bacterium]
MNKINKIKITNIIIYCLGILGILAFSILVTKQANAYGYYGGTSIDYGYQVPIYNSMSTNPSPTINSINPKSSNVGTGTKTITIIGNGFVPSSIARINGSNRPTTFIDSSHLLMQITGNDTYNYRSNGGFFIAVFNGLPGGGNSNTAFFTVTNTATSNTTTTKNVNNTVSNFIDENYGNNLASNAIFGSNGILPSGLIQWILFAILLLLIVILVRKIYGGGEKYHATPLKHE